MDVGSSIRLRPNHGIDCSFESYVVEEEKSRRRLHFLMLPAILLIANEI
jgi:hypothetical protein